MRGDPFWARYREDDNGCWLWTRGKNTYGYGKYRDGSVVLLAHRQAWVLSKGSIPDGMKVLHRCDVRACINPAHLFLGTQADNVRDCAAKGRLPRGETHPNSVLSEVKVRRIRKMFSLGYTQREISRRVGISNQHISDICARKKWHHLK